ncbi:MAG TPA: protein kinase [Baekduia sp.]|nr:protein kinase [Baekduia sp.]
MSTQLGTLLSGRYRLDARIGTGGMSTVFRALDTVLERQVAIKLMHRDIAGQADQLERFRREARAVAQLNHPHVVGVIDAGEDDGTPYIVFEYVDGETLKQRIRRHGRLPVAEAVAYAIEIARALGAAHDCGIVHRDVKPQNVLVDEEGSAKVTDFGIARTLDQDGLTADGRVLGTTDYVSPEQALGHSVTGQSDLYSLGVVLFEMLTGDVPFHGENQVAVAMKHVREDIPDVQLLRPEVSSSLAAVLDRATHKDLAQRYSSDAELIADLEDVLAIEAARSGQVTGEATAVLRTLPPSARGRLPGRITHPTRIFLVLALIAAALVAFGVFVLADDRATRGTGTPPAAQDERGRKLTPISLRQSGAGDFDPRGDQREHQGEVRLAVDQNPNTAWTTESYQGGAMGKDGVGVYVDAAPAVAARRLDVRTNRPGFAFTVYGAEQGPPQDLGGWTKLATSRATETRTRVPLDTGGRRLRYYLVWITALPEGASRAEVAEIFLYR